MPQNSTDYLGYLGYKESTDNYQIVNSLGYMGKYQFGIPALTEAGFYKSGGWNGSNALKYGAVSQLDFLNNPLAQEVAIRAFTQKNYTYIKNYGLDDYIGNTVGGVNITLSGMLAGAHLVGIGALKTLILLHFFGQLAKNILIHFFKHERCLKVVS